MGYYFISVGGSGARVLESLTHLCVAGLMPNQEKEGHLYVMSIDPDTGNGNLTRTGTLLNCLNKFQDVQVGKGTPLLKTPLRLPKPFFWSPAKLDTNLDRVISYQHYSEQPIGKLYESLYTKKERQTILNEGFRGRPSIGAAVMGLKAKADVESAFHNLIDAVKSDVQTNGSAQIFLAGSVFGGTGAAGLPTIARILRENRELKQHCQEGKIRIGGALLLPYFSFAPTAQQKKESGLFASSDNFLTNTKAALRYYSDTGGSGYDSMYFVGDETMLPMPVFSVGAANQRNDAHIVDFFAAMAAVHFYCGNEGKHCYYISREKDRVFQWQDLPDVTMYDDTKVSVREYFVQFTRFILAYLHIVKPVLPNLANGKEPAHAHPWYKDYWKDKIDVNASDVRNFEQYAEQFVVWLDQVEHSAGARSVELINPKVFSTKNNQAKIMPDFFSTMDYGNGKVNINEVRARLARGKRRKRSITEMIFGSKKDTESTEEGFGLFLRRLYDSCASN
ncbi:MAG: hypothetical protein IKI08_04295 [Selenomonadaceae bacterium]|nr:hypothetical protein [Selenomonadaceae bacterium]